jgi:hypothetical protein
MRLGAWEKAAGSPMRNQTLPHPRVNPLSLATRLNGCPSLEGFRASVAGLFNRHVALFLARGFPLLDDYFFSAERTSRSSPEFGAGVTPSTAQSRL